MFDNHKIFCNKGFTLVEMIVALSLLSIILVLLNTFLLSSLISWHNSRDKAEVEENLRIGINRLTRELRQAKYIVSFETNPKNKLNFRSYDGKLLSYFCSMSNDSEQASQLIRAVNNSGNNPVARYVNEIMVDPANCNESTKLLHIILAGEKGRSGEVKVKTTIMLRESN